MAGVADINGDGFDDVLVTASQHDPQYSFVHATYVVFGQEEAFAVSTVLSALPGSGGFRLDSNDNPNLFGNHVAAAGDVNGDGLLIFWSLNPNTRQTRRAEPGSQLPRPGLAGGLA